MKRAFNAAMSHHPTSPPCRPALTPAPPSPAPASGPAKQVKDYRVYVAREILHHGSLRHPFIVGLYEVFLTPRHVCIVLEYAEGGDLYRFLQAQPQQRLTEPLARYLFQQLILGVQYIHGRGVANRDVKLENLLLTKLPAPGAGAVLKICDFGYSKHEYNSSARTHVGTPIYMSPEIIMGGNRYDAKKADVWSAGVVLYVVLTGRYPFDREAPDYAKSVMQGRWAPIDPALEISAQGQDLVGAMLRSDPGARTSLEEIVAHPWFGAAALPPEVLGMNAGHWASAPDPSHPPLSGAAAAVGEVVSRGAEAGAPGEARLGYSFPAAAALAQLGAASAGAAQDGSSDRGTATAQSPLTSMSELY